MPVVSAVEEWIQLVFEAGQMCLLAGFVVEAQTVDEFAVVEDWMEVGTSLEGIEEELQAEVV